MVKKHILLYLFIFVIFIQYSIAQSVTDEFIEEDNEGFVTHEEVYSPANENTVEETYKFKPDNTISEAENNFIQAVFKNDSASVESMLKTGISANILYSYSSDNGTVLRTSPLHIAIASKDKKIFNILINSKNINLDIPGYVLIKKNNSNIHLNLSPLSYAVYLKYYDFAEELLKKGANPNFKAKGVYPALFFAHDEKSISLLQKYQADMDIESDNKTTPLFYAVESNNTQLVTLLINNGANINKVDGDNNTLLYAAISKGYFDMARFLIDYGAEINKPSGKEKITPLMAALARVDHDAGFLRYIIFKGADVLAKDVNKRTPLFYLYDFKDDIGKANVIESIAILMENNVDINAQDINGNTVIHLQPKNYYKLYAKYNPNINLQNKEGNTPLHIAAMQDNITSILTGSPDRSIKNKKGETALNIAEKNHFDNSTTYLRLSNKECLLMFGALYGDNVLIDKAIALKVNINNAVLGKHPLYYAAVGGNPDVFVKMLNAGADVASVPNMLYEVIGSFNQGKNQANRVKLSNIFIERIASLNWDKYKNLVHILVKEQSEENKGQGFIREVLSYALSMGASVNNVDEKGRTPLHIAAGGKYESYDLVLELISGGVEIDKKDYENNPAIYYAAKVPYGKSDVFLALLNNSKLDINARYGEKGNTLLMEAAGSGNRLIAMMLIARGADDSLVNNDNKTAYNLAVEGFAKHKTASVEEQKERIYKDYKFLVENFLNDKNTVAECRSGINEECKKYYKPVEVINK